MRKIIQIAAVDDVWGIGKEGKLPWHIPGEMEHFKTVTTNHVVVMGRNTYYSLPKKYRPLPNRVNLVLGSHLDREDRKKCVHCTSISQVLREWDRYPAKYLFVCGGATVYNEFKYHATDIILSRIPGDYECDTFFPMIDKVHYRETGVTKRDGFEIVTYSKSDYPYLID